MNSKNNFYYSVFMFLCRRANKIIFIRLRNKSFRMYFVFCVQLEACSMSQNVHIEVIFLQLKKSCGEKNGISRENKTNKKQTRINQKYIKMRNCGEIISIVALVGLRLMTCDQKNHVVFKWVTFSLKQILRVQLQLTCS